MADLQKTIARQPTSPPPAQPSYQQPQSSKFLLDVTLTLHYIYSLQSVISWLTGSLMLVLTWDFMILFVTTSCFLCENLKVFLNSA